MKTSRKKIKKKFTLQQDQSDCGVSCLRNILSFYQAELSLEKLREWSGTGSQGTSLLGLQQAATRAGFAAAGMKAEKLANLQEIQTPCILAVTIDDQLLHYIVYYPVPGDGEKGHYLIGDPARGLVDISAIELDQIWVSKALLTLMPEEKLAKWQKQQRKKLRWLWETLREDIHFLIIAMILGAGASALNLSTAVFSQKLIDTILPGRHRDQLIAGLALLGMLFLIRSLLGYIRQSLLIRQGFQFNSRLTGGFYRSILYLNKFFFDNRKTGDLIARLNDTLRIQQATAYILGEMTIQLLMLLVTLGLLFFYSWPLGLCCLIMIPAVYGVVKYFEDDIVLQQRESMIGYSRNESNYVDSIRGIHTIKVMNKEPLFINLAKNIFSSFQEAVWRLGQRKIRFNTCLEIMTSLFLLAIIGWSALEVLNGRLKTGQMIAILQLAGVLMQSTVAVALTNLQVQEAGVAMDRMYEFTTIDPEYDLATNEETGHPAPTRLLASLDNSGSFGIPAETFEKRMNTFENLTIKNLVFRFPGKKPLLHGLSFSMHKGQIVAIAGESGQGKSTLFQVLQKFYPYDGGHILADGKELATIATPDWRKLIGVVPQDIVLFSGNLLANICLDTDPIHITRLEGFCRHYGFDQYFEKFPQSYQTMLGEGGIALSGGQKQLMALARCLYAEPQLLLLDEPTSAMDAGTEEFVLRILQKIKKEKAILVISHKDSLTGIADETYWLKGGSCSKLPVVINMEETHV